jgi:zinc/manganese transport system substrate-binding protein
MVNGGGYDSFMDGLVDQAEGSRVVLRAVEGEGDHDHDEDHSDEDHSEEEHSEDEDHAHEESEHDHDSHADGNEHVWYDFHVVEEVADQVLASLTQLRPDSAGDFQANHLTFVGELEVLEVRLEALREDALGYGVFSLTPLASIMIEDAGFDEYAPSELLEAVEEERDIPPASIAQAEEIFQNPDLLMVVINDQVTDTQMESMTELAESNGLPVVGLSELIPNEDWDYLDWMANNLDVLMSTVDQVLPEQTQN